MTRSSQLFVLSVTAFASLLGAGSLQGCRDHAQCITCDIGTTPGADGGPGDAGGPGNADAGPTVPTVTIAQITDPTASGFVTGTQVRLSGLVATTIKFEVSKSSAGECSWGVFLSTPGLTVAAPHSAILTINNGTPASASDGGPAQCPTLQANQPAGDLFPDDTLPGDVFDIVGFATSVAPSACVASAGAVPNMSTVGQYQLNALSAVTRTSRGAAVPAPYVFTAGDAASLSAGQDATFLGEWGGALVTVENLMAVEQQGSLVDAYGHLLLSDGLQIGDKLYFVKSVAATDSCYAGPDFANTPTFSSISGIVYLDYCTWGIDPLDKCNDFVPPSNDCASVADAGPGASPAMVCEHAPVGGTP